MKKVFLNISLCLLAGSLVLVSCKKDEEMPMDDTVEDSNYGMTVSDEVISVAEEVMVHKGYANGRVAAGEQTTSEFCGATITITEKDGAGTILIDFGSTGLECNDKKVRKGKIKIDFDGKYKEDAKTQTISLDNYYVNGNKIEGTKVLYHSWVNGKVVTSIKVTGGKITFIDNSKIEWNSDRERTWDTKGTASLGDDEISIMGTFNGKNKSAKSFDGVITSPLLLKVSCIEESRFIPVSGTMKITPQGTTDRIIDFGKGTCDREATLTINGRSKSFILK